MERSRHASVQQLPLDLRAVPFLCDYFSFHENGREESCQLAT